MDYPGRAVQERLSHSVYLTDAMLAVLNAVPRFNNVDFLFPSRDSASRPMSGDQKVKRRIDRRMREMLAKQIIKEQHDWCVYDFRRTIATRLQRLEFSPDIEERNVIVTHNARP